MTTSGGPDRAPRRPPLARIARVLIGYGAIGTAAAALGAVFVLIGLARVNGLADRAGGEFGGVTAVLARTATVLDDAAATSRGFGSTVQGSQTALTSAAGNVRAIVPRLRDLETQANAVNLLGSQPLAPLAGLFGQIASQLEGLDQQLDTVANSLLTNQAELQTNATSLEQLAAETRTLETQLGGGALTAAIDDTRWLLVAVLVVASIGALVPAVGALAAGLWLRRRLLERTTRRPA